MTRDEIILSFQPIVDNIVKKYNNHNSDDDLQSVGMIKCIKAVDRCLSEGVTDPEQMKPRVIVWAKNAILDALRVIKTCNKLDSVEDCELGDDSDYSILVTDTKLSLSGKTLLIFNMLLEGYSQDEICDKLNIKYVQYYKYLSKIKKSISEKNDV